jgi:hypothetical protein
MTDEKQILPVKGNKNIYLAIAILCITCGLLIGVFWFGGSSPQIMQLTFLSLLSMGFFYDSQKSFFIRQNHPLLSKMGIAFIWISMAGLVLTIISAISSGETIIQIASVVTSIFLAIGLFYTRRAFSQLTEMESAETKPNV